MRDEILLDDIGIAKAMLIDKKVFEFCGKISLYSMLFDKWDSITLEQSSGYKIDLLLRLQELTQNYGSKMSISYWVAKSPKTAEELVDFTAKSQEGFLDIDFDAREIVYSEYTRDMEYDTDLSIGGHNLLKELQKKNGQYLYMMVECDGS